MRLITDDALAILTIWMEAQGEPFEGKCAVGEVIRNRMARRYSSDGTVAGTVARRLQFSSWNDDQRDRDLLIRGLGVDDLDPVVADCRRAWETALAGSSYAMGAILYVNPAISQPAWATEDRLLTKIGNHSFYSDGRK